VVVGGFSPPRGGGVGRHPPPQPHDMSLATALARDLESVREKLAGIRKDNRKPPR
jgi:hypothetical protein